MAKETSRKPFSTGNIRDPKNPVFKPRTKQRILINAQGNFGTRKVETQAGTVVFQDNVAALPNDGRGQEMADEIVQTHGKHPDHFAVIPNREGPGARDRVHNYFWGSWPQMPWKKEGEEPNGTQMDSYSQLNGGNL